MKILIATIALLTAGLGGILGFFKSTDINIQNNNHNNPRQVAQETDESKKNLDELIDIVQKQDPRAALGELSNRMKTNETVFKNCHLMAHKIGRIAYDKYKDLDTALKYQDTTCSDG